MKIEQSFNLKVVDTKDKILKVIQEAQLPAVVIQMVMRETTNAIDTQVQSILQKEKTDYENLLKTSQGGK